MRTMYETASDLSNEAAVRSYVAQTFSAEVNKVPLSYGVDSMVTVDDKLVAWLEIKCRPGMTWGQYPDVMVSVLKLRAAAGLKASTGIDTYFVVADSTGVIKSANLCKTSPEWIKYGGRTAQTRDSADIEPVCHIPLDQFTEGTPWDQ
jgi:hypothetical protein